MMKVCVNIAFVPTHGRFLQRQYLLLWRYCMSGLLMRYCMFVLLLLIDQVPFIPCMP
jgi:hypothetical protein